jgi:hypothetical protein
LQLEEIKAARGLNVDDGTAAADKPLAEVLAERKKAKQDAFDEQWKQMKTGEQRPLHSTARSHQQSAGAQQHVRRRCHIPASSKCLPHPHKHVFRDSPKFAQSRATSTVFSWRLGLLCCPLPLAALASSNSTRPCCCGCWLAPAGKNRPLDEDELQFYDSLAQQEAAQHRRMRQEEDEELAAFRQAVAAAAEAKAAAAEAKAAAAEVAGGEGDAAAEAGPGPGSAAAAELGRSGSGPAAAKPSASKVYSKTALPVLKPILKAKPKGAAGGGKQGNSSSSAGHNSKLKASDAAQGGSPGRKKQRLEDVVVGQQQQQQQQQGAGAGLAGLLGGYGSGSDDADD